MLTEINIRDIFSLQWPVIDVRSPGEFEHGNIPGAVNIPLFTNDERAHIGTVYKKQSKEEAIELGYQYVTPKLDDFITESLKVAPKKRAIIHCWRGGMRSRSFAQHLMSKGFKDIKVVTGGYKAYRNMVLTDLSTPIHINVLGGYTGSGKTYILQELQKRGHQVLDLEGLAKHKGSAFGGIGQGDQPTVEQFGNNLHQAWHKLDLNKPIWVEDESYSIGSVNIPIQFFNQMRNAKLYFIDVPTDERVKHLVSEYAGCNNQDLADAILRIAKRLGGLNVNNAIEQLKNGNYSEVAKITLHYYDKYYLKGMQKRNSSNIIRISLPTINHYENALKIEKYGYEQSKTNTI